MVLIFGCARFWVAQRFQRCDQSVTFCNRGFSPRRGLRIRTYNLCFLGFGNVNRTLVRLLLDREPELRDRYGISFRITGIATRRLGWIANPDGLDIPECVERAPSPAKQPRIESEANQRPHTG